MSSNRPGTGFRKQRGLSHTIRQWHLKLQRCPSGWFPRWQRDTACQSYHGAEGMPQEDGMSVQEGLVSTTLRCLQITQKHMKLSMEPSQLSPSYVSVSGWAECWGQGLHTNHGDHKLQALQTPLGSFSTPFSPVKSCNLLRWSSRLHLIHEQMGYGVIFPASWLLEWGKDAQPLPVLQCNVNISKEPFRCMWVWIKMQKEHGWYLYR